MLVAPRPAGFVRASIRPELAAQHRSPAAPEHPILGPCSDRPASDVRSRIMSCAATLQLGLNRGRPTGHTPPGCEALHPWRQGEVRQHAVQLHMWL